MLALEIVLWAFVALGLLDVTIGVVALGQVDALFRLLIWLPLLGAAAWLTVRRVRTSRVRS